MTDEIKISDKFSAIVKNPYLVDDRDLILPFAGGLLKVFFNGLSLERLGKMIKTWNPQSIANGLNAIIAHKKSGVQVRHDFWNDQAKTADPTRKGTGMLFFPAATKAPFVLVCPGGAYMSVASIVEGFPVAAALNRMGYSAFVMTYRTVKNSFPKPQYDLAQAVHYILDHANELNVERDGYAVCGFSAGGHLAASFGSDNLGYLEFDLPAPRSLILAYPVISMGKMTHAISRKMLLGKSPTAEQIKETSVEAHVHAGYPPTYIWHCNHDNTVDFQNSVLLSQALEKAKVAHFLKEVDGTAHGWGLAEGTAADGWLDKAVKFWQGIK